MTTNSYVFYTPGLLLIFGIFFAWETRKVRIEALNDSKLIGKLNVFVVQHTNPTFEPHQVFKKGCGSFFHFTPYCMTLSHRRFYIRLTEVKLCERPTASSVNI